MSLIPIACSKYRFFKFVFGHFRQCGQLSFGLILAKRLVILTAFFYPAKVSENSQHACCQLIYKQIYGIKHFREYRRMYLPCLSQKSRKEKIDGKSILSIIKYCVTSKCPTLQCLWGEGVITQLFLSH